MDIFETDHRDLLQRLYHSGKEYPLLTSTYTPIIENYYKQVPRSEFICDWLCIPHFEFLYCSSTDQLQALENELQLVSKAIGNEEFKRLQNGVINGCSKSFPINSIHNKILDFRGELLAIKYHYEKGYKVQQIPTSSEKNQQRPDIKVVNANETTAVESKFVHDTRPITRYLHRYIRMLSFCWEPYIKSKRFLIDKVYCDINESKTNILPLSLDNTNEIKQFAQKIILDNPDEYSTTLVCKIREENEKKSVTQSITLSYEKQEELPSDPSTICSQANFISTELDSLRIYLDRLRNDRIIPQLSYAGDNGWSKSAFICIKLDEEFGAPFTECKDAVKNKFDLIKADFLNEGIKLIIYDASGYL